MNNELTVRSYNPKVSMNPAVYYKTAGASYDRLLDNGPLTDSRIAKYALEGRYGPEAQAVEQAKLSERQQAAHDAAEREKRKRKLQKALVAYE